MLLIQDICLSWGKKERTSACAEIRAKFPMAHLLDHMPGIFQGGVLVNHLSFLQKGTVIEVLHRKNAYRYQFFSSVRDLNLTNLDIQLDEDGYRVAFFYDERRSGKPVRRGHNKDYHNEDSSLYYCDILNETAFFLRQGQYGRVVWNERRTDCDTGEWYYQLHVINLFYLNKMPEADIFLTHKQDFEYRRTAALY